MTSRYDASMTDWVGDARMARIQHALTLIDIPNLKGGSEKTGPCPVCGGKDRFAVNTRKNMWNCRQCQKGGKDAIGLVMHVEGCNFIAACEILNGSPAPRGTAKPMSQADRDKRARDRVAAQRRQDEFIAADRARRFGTVKGIWATTVPLFDAPVEYLKRRGIDPSIACDQIRAHRNLPYPNVDGVFPAIVARLCDVHGSGTAIWRIYLKMDGSDKAPVENPKLGLGVASGSSVRLGGFMAVKQNGKHDHYETIPHEEIIVAEGLETALAVRELTESKYPVWATLSTSGMIGLLVPRHVRRVRIFADHDTPKIKGERILESPGMKAARSLQNRIHGTGCQAQVEAPPIGSDWLDVLVACKALAAKEKDAA